MAEPIIGNRQKIATMSSGYLYFRYEKAYFQLNKTDKFSRFHLQL